MPDSLKIKGHKSKYILKKIAQKILPASIIQRPKQGFELPLDEWIRGDLASFFHDLVLDGYLQRTGLFNNSYIEALYKDQYDGRVDHGARIWMLANLRLWFERFSVGV
jgi:asparagine synthase (glutamine-hydrolysing)